MLCVEVQIDQFPAFPAHGHQRLFVAGGERQENVVSDLTAMFPSEIFEDVHSNPFELGDPEAFAVWIHMIRLERNVKLRGGFK